MRVPTLLALLALAACPIQPDNFGDGGPDGGPSDGGVATTDAGAPASGSVSCLVGSAYQTLSAAWSGADLAGTTGSGSSVEIQAVNGASGSLTLTFIGLVPGSTAGSLAAASYQAPSGFMPQDSWSCSSDCSAVSTAFAYDGAHVTGSFSQLDFPAAQSSTGADPLSLTNLSFAVTLPSP